MKNIAKVLVGILFSALVMAPSYAGEMTVTGGATATYATNGADSSAGKNIGISNELDFTASGELDNGYTWKYQVQLDGDNAANDDTRLEIGTDMGTVGFYVSEGGLSSELAYGIGALGTGFDYASTSTFQHSYDVDGYSNIQYHLPADMLPFGLGLKVGYAPNMQATAGLSAKAAAGAGNDSEGRSLKMLQVSAAPVDGLSIQGSVAEPESVGGDANKDDGVSANVGAKYTLGQLSIGYGEGGYQPATGLTAGDATIYYENKYMGVQFDVNDALSVSYNVDESEKNTNNGITATQTSRTKTVVAMEQDTIQLAYTTGGATIGIADIDVSNADYTTGKTESMTVISLAIAF